MIKKTWDLVGKHQWLPFDVVPVSDQEVQQWLNGLKNNGDKQLLQKMSFLL